MPASSSPQDNPVVGLLKCKCGKVMKVRRRALGRPGKCRRCGRVLRAREDRLKPLPPSAAPPARQKEPLAPDPPRAEPSPAVTPGDSDSEWVSGIGSTAGFDVGGMEPPSPGTEAPDEEPDTDLVDDIPLSPDVYRGGRPRTEKKTSGTTDDPDWTDSDSASEDWMADATGTMPGSPARARYDSLEDPFESGRMDAASDSGEQYDSPAEEAKPVDRSEPPEPSEAGPPVADVPDDDSGSFHVPLTDLTGEESDDVPLDDAEASSWSSDADADADQDEVAEEWGYSGGGGHDSWEVRMPPRRPDFTDSAADEAGEWEDDAATPPARPVRPEEVTTRPFAIPSAEVGDTSSDGSAQPEEAPPAPLPPPSPSPPPPVPGGTMWDAVAPATPAPPPPPDPAPPGRSLEDSGWDAVAPDSEPPSAARPDPPDESGAGGSWDSVAQPIEVTPPSVAPRAGKRANEESGWDAVAPPTPPPGGDPPGASGDSTGRDSITPGDAPVSPGRPEPPAPMEKTSWDAVAPGTGPPQSTGPPSLAGDAASSGVADPFDDSLSDWTSGQQDAGWDLPADEQTVGMKGTASPRDTGPRDSAPRASTPPRPAIPRARVGKHRAPWLIFPLCLGSLAVYYFVWVFAVSRELRDHIVRRRGLSPAMLLGLHLVPPLTLVWPFYVLYRLSADVNLMQVSEGRPNVVAPAAVAGLALAGTLLSGAGAFLALQSPVGWVFVAAGLGPWCWAFALVQDALNAHWALHGP